MSYGLSSTGFLRKSLTVIQQEISTQLKSLINAGLDTAPTSVLGQIIGVISDRIDELWALALAVYRSQYPDSASGESLEALAALTKTYRIAAQPSEVELDQLYLDSGTTLLAGQIVSVSTTGLRFITLEDVSNTTGAPGTFSVAAISEDNGPIQGNATTIDTIETPVVGWSAATALTSDYTELYTLANGQTLLIKIDDGSEQTITFLTGDFVDIGNATAAEVAAVIDANLIGAGAVDANGSVRIINSSEDAGNSIQVTGGTANTELGFSTSLIKGFNSLDADLGRFVETDAELRLRREELLRGLGSGTVEAIRAQLLLLDGVVQAYVFNNPTLAVDGNGLPPKSFEAVVAGGDDADIFNTLFLHGPAGIETYGSESEVIEDSQGFDHTIKFSRPTDIDIYIDVTVLVDSGDFPLDGEDQIKTAIVNEGDLLLIGEDVIALRFKAVPLDIAGVTDVTDFKIDVVSPPTGTSNIVLAIRELARFDTSRITVTVT